MAKRISFLEALQEVFNAEAKEREEYAKTSEFRHNPSSASFKFADGSVAGSCLRQLYYKATKVPESNPADFTSKLQMGFGDAVHTFLLGKLSKSKAFQLTSEASGKCTLDPLRKEISYRLDGLVGYDGTVGCLEIKSKQSFAVQRMMKEGTGPSIDNICQVVSYFGTNPLLSWANLVYIGRDNALRTEYQIEKDGDKFICHPILPIGHTYAIPEVTFAGIVKRWHELEEFLKSKTKPPREYKVVFNDDGKIVDKRVKKGVDYKSDWRCLYCQFKDQCWGEEGAKQDSKEIK